MWTYMEAVFSSGDIVRQLPIEANRFLAIDKTFMKVQRESHHNPAYHETYTHGDAMMM
jgi:hypothetical protein